MSSAEYHRLYQARRGAARWAWAIDKLGGRCVICGSQSSLELDHIDPKSKSFTISGCGNVSQARFEAEVAKCQVLCSEHHHEKSNRERGRNTVKGKGVHGTVSSYRYCKCELCRAANARAGRPDSKRRDSDGPKHGTRSRYNHHGCRCDLCCAAQREYMACYHKQKVEK